MGRGVIGVVVATEKARTKCLSEDKIYGKMVKKKKIER